MDDSPINIGNEADVLAKDGHGKRVHLMNATAGLPSRIACRDADAPMLTEHSLIDRIEQTCLHAGCAVPRWLIVNYYVSLKTNPLLILAGAEGMGKVDFTQLFAGALLGSLKDQFALIPGRAVWHTATGEGSYYRSVHERFTSLRFLEVLQEASRPANAGKLYIVSFQRLHPGEVEPYLASLVQISQSGEWRLSLPGTATEHQPLIPTNLRITATIDTSDDMALLNKAALRNAGVIDVSTPLGQRQLPLTQITPPAPGYERLWLRVALNELEAARQRLRYALGNDHIDNYAPSMLVSQALRRHGLLLSKTLLRELTIAVANSFDASGQGLFVPYDPHCNAQIAYDTQIIQRIRWQARAGQCPSISDYFAWIRPERRAA